MQHTIQVLENKSINIKYKLEFKYIIKYDGKLLSEQNFRYGWFNITSYPYVYTTNFNMINNSRKFKLTEIDPSITSIDALSTWLDETKENNKFYVGVSVTLSYTEK